METSNNILKIVKALLLPAVLVLLTCYGLYQSHEASIAIATRQAVTNPPAYSIEGREWLNWAVNQPGYADPEKFLHYLNTVKK